MKLRKLQAQKLTLSLGADKFIFDCKARRLSPRTIEFYESILKRFIAFTGDVPLRSTTRDDVNAFLIHESDRGLSDSSLHGIIRGLKAFFNYHKHQIDLKQVKVQQKIIQPFSEKQIKVLLKQPDKKTFSGLRDYVLMLLLYDTGIRISEATSIRKKDILESGQIYVMGKGKKERIVPVGNTCFSALQEYIKAIDDLSSDKPIFVTVYNNVLNRQTFNRRVQAYAKKAGITGVRVSCHTFRHSFAKNFLMNGGDIYSLKAILGHETLEMVKKYLALCSADIQAQHKKFSPVDSLIGKKRTLTKKDPP